MIIKKEIFIKVYQFLQSLRDKTRAQQVDEDYLLVEEARKEWKSARDYFDAVTDPDLIDHAIYALEAAEKRYIYLLKRIREEQAFHAPVREGAGNRPVL